MKELKEMLDKHKKILEGDNWIQAIIILSFFWGKYDNRRIRCNIN